MTIKGNWMEGERGKIVSHMGEGVLLLFLLRFTCLQKFSYRFFRRCQSYFSLILSRNVHFFHIMSFCGMDLVRLLNLSAVYTTEIGAH